MRLTVAGDTPSSGDLLAGKALPAQALDLVDDGLPASAERVDADGRAIHKSARPSAANRAIHLATVRGADARGLAMAFGCLPASRPAAPSALDQ